jgi:uncharacterized membrane protein
MAEKSLGPSRARNFTFGFQQRPLDLYASIAFSATISIILLALDAPSPFAAPLAAFLPGYVIVAVLFPARGEIDWVERILLSFALSVVTLAFVALTLSYSAFGIRFGPMVASTGSFNVAIGTFGLWRRSRLPPGERLSLKFSLSRGFWANHSVPDKALTVALVTVVVAAGAMLGYHALVSVPASDLTEFYMLGPSGAANGYPERLNVSQLGKVVLVVASSESKPANYTIQIALVGVEVRYNSTAGRNETKELNRTIRPSIGFGIPNGGTWQQEYDFKIASSGLWRLEFSLFRNTNLTSFYRQLRLMVTVT